MPCHKIAAKGAVETRRRKVRICAESKKSVDELKEFDLVAITYLTFGPPWVDNRRNLHSVQPVLPRIRVTQKSLLADAA